MLTVEDMETGADIVFMALTIWREGRGESITCQEAIGYCIMNRVKKPCWWGTDIFSVLFKKWQFSSLTDPKDKQLTTWPVRTSKDWEKSIRVAYNVFNGYVLNPVLGADSYFDESILNPKWATPDKFVAKIDRISFYNLDMDVEV